MRAELFNSYADQSARQCTRRREPLTFIVNGNWPRRTIRGSRYVVQASDLRVADLQRFRLCVVQAFRPASEADLKVRTTYVMEYVATLQA